LWKDPDLFNTSEVSNVKVTIPTIKYKKVKKNKELKINCKMIIRNFENLLKFYEHVWQNTTKGKNT
jgi:hypothetical protein